MAEKPRPVRVVGKRRIVREREITADDNCLEDHDFGTGADGQLVIREEVEVSEEEYRSHLAEQRKGDRKAVNHLVENLKPSGYAVYLAVLDAIGRTLEAVRDRLDAGKNLFVVVRAPSPSWQLACEIGAVAALAELSLRSESAQIDASRILPSRDGRMSIPVGEVVGKLENAHVVLVLRPQDGDEPQLGPLVDTRIDLSELPSAFLNAAAARGLGRPGESVSLRLRASDMPAVTFDAAVSRATTASEVVDLVIQLIASQMLSEHLSESGKRKDADEDEKEKAADLAAIDAFMRRLPPEPPNLLVIRKLEDGGSTGRRSILGLFKPLAEQPSLLRTAEGVRETTDRMIARWPHAAEVIRRLVGELRQDEPFRIRPTLLVGPPGTGKTSLLTHVVNAFGIASVVYPCASVFDSSFGGTSAQWSTCRASIPLEAIRKSGKANPAIVLDEIEKAGRSESNGSLVHTLLPMLEKHTAAAFFDIGLETDVDLSGVTFLATANSLDGIPDPLRDRFRVIRMPEPTHEHLPVLAAGVIDNLVRDRGLFDGMIEALAPDELAVVGKAWAGGSLRKLRAAVEATVDFRDSRRTMQ